MLLSHISCQKPPDDEFFAGNPFKKVLAVQHYLRGNNFDKNHSHFIRCAVRDYDLCCEKISLTEQRWVTFSQIFSGSAWNFFFDHCHDKMTFEQLAEVMVFESEFYARRPGAKSNLETLKIEAG